MTTGKCSVCGIELSIECDSCSTELSKGDNIICAQNGRHYCDLECYAKAL